MTTGKKGYDRLAKILKGVPPKKIREALVKSEAVTIRLTLSDKTEMQQAAKACGLTLTDYLIHLHHFAVKRLKGDAEE